jgi:sugar-specific transcriptional regulator TrmB
MMMETNIPKTKEELEQQVDTLAKRLEIVGLSKYEARAYLGLLAHGFGPAETIANTARIPRTSAYKVLDSLCVKKFATATPGRPKIYRPEIPQRIQERMVEEITDLFTTIKLLSDIVNERGFPLLVYTIQGRDRVIKKMIEMIDSSTTTVLISTPLFSQLTTELQKPIQKAVKRGVDVTLIAPPSSRVPEKVKVVRRKDLIATDIISDGSVALIASVDLEVCGYSDNEFISLHLLRFLESKIQD